MCGIAGIVKLDNTNLPASANYSIKKMTDAMSWRGPDGEGHWLSGPVCFGHRRLSIIDLAGGHQPMLDINKNYCIVFNGEIYNFKELRVQLENSGMKFNTNCDTEVILNSYACYGDDCLNYLEGMFAFALWDKIHCRLFCARDHFGKKPFYYICQGGYFVFSSELSSLTTISKNCDFFDFNFDLNPSALTRYLAYEYTPAPQTMFSEVNSLEPSHKLIVENSNISTKRYWDLPFPNNDLIFSEEDACENLFSLMNRATKLRMISDVPLGVFLSGGIDSTIVAGLMAKNSSTPIKTFSIGFSESSYDESKYARIAAEAYGTEHYERILSAEECAEELPGIVSKMDTPMADASCAPTWLLAGLARENVTVCLGGDGADEFWAGYEHYIGFKISQIYNKLPHWFRSIIIEKIANILPASSGYINPRLAVKTFLAGANSPDWLRVQTMLTAFDADLQQKILNTNWLNTNGRNLLNQDILFSPTKKQYYNWLPEDKAPPIARAFYVYIRQFMLDDILVKIDRCSMLHSLEVRAPFLDKKVTEFVASLPVACKLHGFKRKYLLKKTFSKLLPTQILNRNKRGFQIPVAAWLRGKLKPLLLEMLSPERLKTQGIFDPESTEILIKEHLSGIKDLRKPLWTLLVLQLWLEANKHVL